MRFITQYPRSGSFRRLVMAAVGLVSCLLCQYVLHSEPNTATWNLDTLYVDRSPDSLGINGFISQMRTGDPTVELQSFLATDPAWPDESMGELFISSTDRDTTYWFKFVISNRSEDTLERFLRCPNFHLMDLEYESGSRDTMLHSGYYKAHDDRAFKGHPRVFPITLLPYETLTCHLKARFTNTTDSTGPKQFTLYTRLYVQRDSLLVTQESLIDRVLMAAILGMLLFFGIFSMLHYLFLRRDTSELYYSLYLFSAFLTMLRDFERDVTFNFIWSYFDMGSFYVEPLLAVSMILFYTLFIRDFLNIKKNFPKSYSIRVGGLTLRFPGSYIWTKVMLWVLLLVTSIHVYLMLRHGVVRSQVFFNRYTMFIISPFALLVLIPIFLEVGGPRTSARPDLTFERNLARIVAGGVLILFVFAILAVLSNQMGHWKTQVDIPFISGESKVFSRGGTWLRLGFVIETMVLTFGLAYKQYSYDRERLTSLDRNALTIGGRHLQSHLIQLIGAATRRMEMKPDDKELLDDLVDRLSSYYKEVLDGFTMSDDFTLDDELRVSRDFLEMTELAEQNPRYTFSLPEGGVDIRSAGLILPPLIITTFLENAYEHGVRGYGDPCAIDVMIERITDKEWVISISNSGRVMSEVEYQKIREYLKPENLAGHRLEFTPTDTILHGGRSGRGVKNALARAYLFNKLNRDHRIKIDYDHTAHAAGYTRVELRLQHK